MKITRNNYEELFLLYVDGELSSAGRQVVEDFISENPDLKPELDFLKESVLSPVNMEFDKSALHKSAKAYLPSDERILPYIDNELLPAEAEAFVTEMAANPLLNDEVELLLQTKLDISEIIPFKNKRTLYRKEQGRLVAMRFVRIAVAAAILALLLTGIWVYMGNEPANNVAKEEKQPLNNHSQTIAGSINQGNMRKTDSEKPGQNNVVSIDSPSNQNKQSLAGKLNQNSDIKMGLSVSVSHSPDIRKENRTIDKEMALEKKLSPNRNKTETSPVPLKDNHPLIVNQSPDELIASNPKNDVKAPKSPLTDYNSQVIDNNEYAKMAVLKDESKSDNSIFYVPEEEISKTKVGGILKRVKRVVARRSNIKVANGITIGGFQIALN